MDLLSVLMLLVIYYDNLKSLYSDELDMCWRLRDLLCVSWTSLPLPRRI